MDKDTRLTPKVKNWIVVIIVAALGGIHGISYSIEEEIWQYLSAVPVVLAVIGLLGYKGLSKDVEEIADIVEEQTGVDITPDKDLTDPNG